MLDSKYIIFFIGSAVCLPLGIVGSVNSRRIHDFIFMFLVFGVTQTGSLFGLPTDINFLSREWYRGSTRGIEISYLDLLAIILFVSSAVIRRRDGARFFWPPSLGVLLAFLGWCIVNVVLFSEPKLFGIFECTKVARAILLFVAVTFYIRSSREVRLFVWMMIVAVLYEAAICLVDRYVYHQYRIEGTLGHPNSLSMYCLECVPIFIATFFAHDAPPRMRTASGIAYLAATACVFLTISRMGIVSLVLISGAAFVLSTGIEFNLRNAGFALLGVVLFLVMFAKSWDSFEGRMKGTTLQDSFLSRQSDRGVYIRQGIPAFVDNPITGIGLNNWSFWVTNRYAAEAGYYKFENMPITPYPGTDTPPLAPTQVAPAHNFYIITLAELGGPGFIICMALFIRWLFITGQVLVTRRTDLIARVRLGAFLSVWGILLQSFTEWEFRQTPVFFNGHIIVAVAATLYYHRITVGKSIIRNQRLAR